MKHGTFPGSRVTTFYSEIIRGALEKVWREQYIAKRNLKYSGGNLTHMEGREVATLI
jgi:hypothetical protein